ncbi:MAG: acyl-CoA thioesterase [Gammaproteobacteria bacterium]
MEDPRRLLQSRHGEPSVRTMAMPADANWLGDIFGGWLMSHADIAGATHAYRRAQGKVVTVAVKDFDFVAPVYVGDVVTFFTNIEHVGRTSMKVGVRVYAERPGNEPGQHIEVASASFIYVHVGEDRQKKPLPPATTSDG